MILHRSQIARIVIIATALLANAPGSAAAQRAAPRDSAPATPDTATIVFDSLPRAVITTFSDALQARVPSLTVERSSGTIGLGSRVHVRGVNGAVLPDDPLVFLDGVRLDNATASTLLTLGGQAPSRLDDLDPDDIERVQVLSGPATAALYGAGAENGVLLITTRHGARGPLHWNLHATLGGARQSIGEFPANFDQIGVLSTSGAHVHGCTLIAQGGGACAAIADSLLSANPFEAANPFQTGTRAGVGASVSGGGTAGTFYVGGDFTRQSGVFDVNRTRPSNLHANGDVRLAPTLDLAVQGTYLSDSTDTPFDDNNTLGLLANGLLGPGDTAEFNIPIADLRTLDIGQSVHRVFGGATLTWSPLAWLTTAAAIGDDDLHQQDFQVIPPLRSIGATALESDSGDVRFEQRTMRVTALASWRAAPDLAVETAIGVEHFRQHVIARTALNSGPLFRITHDAASNSAAGTFARASLTWKDRVNLTGGLRHDALHATFTHATATDPSIALAWTVSGEPWFHHPLALTALTLHVAHGTVTTLEDIASSSQLPPPLTGSTAITSPTLRTSETEVGLDATMSTRADVALTWYGRTSRDVNRIVGIVNVRNDGLEAEVGVSPVTTPSLAWRLTVSGALPRNRVTSIDGRPLVFSFFDSQQIRAGTPIGGYWAPPIVGVADLDHNGIIDMSSCTGIVSTPTAGCEVALGDTAVYLGSPFPTRELALGSHLTLGRHVTLSGLLDYRGGQKLLDLTRAFRCMTSLCQEAEDPTAPLSEQVAVAALARGSLAGYIEDASYWKLRELSVELRAPSSWAARVGGRRLALTLAARNLFTWTRYKGFDPEVNSEGQDPLVRADFFTEPNVRYFLSRVDIGW